MSLSAYSAVSAKVHALYGRRLTQEDYSQLCAMKSIASVADYLQGKKGWRLGLTVSSQQVLHREQVETAVRQLYLDECRRIFGFIGRQDRDLIEFPIYRAEQNEILSALRRLRSSHSIEPPKLWTGYMLAHSQLDLRLLHNATTISDVVHAAEDTIFGSCLQRILTYGNNLPSNTFVDSMMQTAYYSTLYKIIRTKHTGTVRQLMGQALDEETDLLNLVQYLRLKKYFSKEDQTRYSFLLPCSKRLRPEYVQQLIAAPDYDAAFALVRTGPYRAVFSSIQSAGLESYLYQLQYSFNRRQLLTGKPTLYTPIAYMVLKEIELRNLVSIIECIRYGRNPLDGTIALIGIDPAPARIS